MSFRQRLMLLTALAIAATVAGASLAVWFVAKHELYDQLDQTLNIQANSSGPYGGLLTVVIHPDGDRSGPPQLPVSERALEVASGNSPGYYANTTVEGVPVREIVVPKPPAGAVLTIVPLQPTRHALARIRFWILLVGGCGIALAAGLAAAVATAALRPVRRLTAAAENVARTSFTTCARTSFACAATGKNSASSFTARSITSCFGRFTSPRDALTTSCMCRPPLLNIHWIVRSSKVAWGSSVTGRSNQR